MTESEQTECPLCMEPLEIDDLNFYPCSCGYQICRFCWHRIRTDENGLCPACRKPYSEDPAIYRPLTQDEISRINKERKQREAQRKQKISENRTQLSNVRVIQKNLLFVVGLSQRLADAELLKRQEYFGKFGKILKIVVNPSTNYAGPQGPSASAYITYSREEETLRAILGVNNVQLYGRTIRASLGTTKYCTHYLKNTQCHKTDCMYLHEAGDESGSFTKEDMQQGKHQLYEKELLENYLRSIQNKRKSGDLDQFPQMIDEEKEVWLEEDTSASQSSALPPKAAWAIKDVKQDDSDDINKNSTLQTCESNASASEEPQLLLKETTSSHTRSEPIEIFKKDDVYKSDNSASQSESSSLPKELLEPQFATGWATSDETKTTSQYQDIIAEDPGGDRFQIPSWLDDGLGLNNLRVDVDDDLGFDPFTESHRGLETFIAAGQETYPNGPPGVPELFTGSSWQNEYVGSGLPGAGLPSYLPSSEYSLFGSAVPSSGPSLFDVWGGQPVYSSESSIPAPQKGEGSSLGNTEASGKIQGEAQSDIKSWQDGLRALLPNINISFSASLENEDVKAPRKGGRSDPALSKPPPGFVTNEDQSEQSKLLQDSSIIWSKMRLEKEKKRSPPGLAMSQVPNNQLYATKVTKEVTGIERNTPVASWNAIVSGQQTVTPTSKPIPQGASSPGKGGISASESIAQLQPTKPVIGAVGTDASAVGKPLGKANPMFSISSSQNTNKPTAKVKPLKCVVPSEDFLVPSAGAPPPGIERRSGMNDLDDIDFNDPLPPVRVQHVTQLTSDNSKITEEYQGQAGNWKKSSKRKKKKKDVLPAKDAQQLKVDNGIRLPPPSPPKTEPEVKKSILERPQSKGVKDKPAVPTKVLKPKPSEKQLVAAPEDLKPEKTNGKVEVKDPTRVRAKSVESKPTATIAKPQANPSTQQIPLTPSNVQQPVRIAGPRLPTNTRPQIPDSPPKPVTPIRILKSQPQSAGATMTATIAQSAMGRIDPSLLEIYDRESLGRLAESTKLLLQTVLSETEVIKSNTEQISKDLKAALDKCKEPPLTVSDLEKLNSLPLAVLGEELERKQGDNSMIDTSDLEKQVEFARREAELLEVRLNDVIRKNMASDIETLRKKGPEPKQRSNKNAQDKKK